MQKKRKQHHIWRHYLRAWEDERGRVWCQMDREPVRTSTANVGHRRDFYALKEMSEADLRFVEEVVVQRATDSRLQELNRGWFPLFTRVFELRRRWVATGRCDAHIERALDVAINRLEEDSHAAIEGAAIPLLASLRDGETDFLRGDTSAAIHFFQFFALQLMRTPGMLRRVVPVLQEFADRSRWTDLDAEASWGLLRWIFANNVAFGVFANRKHMHITVWDAPSETEFITGDQPIVNTRGLGLEEGSEVTSTNWYYPLSPRLAITFGMDEEDGATERTMASAMQVWTYNHMVAQRSDRQIYSSCESTLKALPRGARRAYR